MLALSFADTFFWGEDLRGQPNPRPTNVLQALISLHAERRADLARNVFGITPDQLEIEAVLRQILETNTCRNLDSPVEVFIDPGRLHAPRSRRLTNARSFPTFPLTRKRHMPKTSAPAPARELDELRTAIEELIQHVRLLTRAVDDLATELQWRNNELRSDGRPDPPFVMTSMPRDPTADDWQLNRLDRDGTPAPERQPPRAARQTLFE